METVYLAITNNGFENALQASNDTGATVWCGAGVLSEGEFESHTGQLFRGSPIQSTTEMTLRVPLIPSENIIHLL